MSSSKQRLASSTATRLAAITDMAANLETQLSELNRLRDPQESTTRIAAHIPQKLQRLNAMPRAVWRMSELLKQFDARGYTRGRPTKVDSAQITKHGTVATITGAVWLCLIRLPSQPASHIARAMMANTRMR